MVLEDGSFEADDKSLTALRASDNEAFALSKLLFDGSSRIANVAFSLLQTFVDLFSNYATDRRNKGGIDGFIQGICTRVGNLGRNTTGFFIYVILELWLSDVACQKRSDVIAEIRRG